MDVRAEYLRRRGERESLRLRHLEVEARFAWSRLAVFAGGLLLAWAIYRSEALGPAWLLVPTLAFAALIVLHARRIAARERAERAVEFYARGLARLDGDWAGKGRPGERFADPHHPYALDLDLFGRGSLYELLCGARTRMGEERLASWLLAPAPPEVARGRQEAVAELSLRLDLREDLAVLSADVEADVAPEALAAWAAAPRLLTGAGPHLLAGAVSLLTLGSVGLWWSGATGPLPVVLAAAVQSAIGLAFRRQVLKVEGAVDRPGRDLELLAQVLARFERERFQAPLLVRLRQELDASGMAPAKAVRRLARRVTLLDSRRNQMFLPVAYLLLWGTHLACTIEAWRARHGGDVARWIAAVGELEALSSLAGYAGEHPEDPFPVLEEAGAAFEADGLAHPLLPPGIAVRNDVRLGTGGALPQILLVSGSNMSGKSTLLRAIGINAVLAQAGAPVRARKLRLSPLAVGATLRVQDSLQEGTSRFFAEVQRLADLVRLAALERPLLFLLDEILHGTNSHDRRLGAEGIVRGLLARGAIGLVTTHDLALAAIADDLGEKAANVHFEDRLEGGRLTFDYTLKPGIVRRSNALELMRSVGLEV